MISDSRSAAATCLGTRSAPRPWSHGSDMVGEADWTVSLRCRSKSYSIVGWTYRSQAPLGGAPSTHARVLNKKQVRCCKKASDARYAAATLPTDSILDEITRFQSSRSCTDGHPVARFVLRSHGTACGSHSRMRTDARLPDPQRANPAGQHADRCADSEEAGPRVRTRPGPLPLPERLTAKSGRQGKVMSIELCVKFDTAGPAALSLRARPGPESR
jgi:hypothetical protein